MGQQVGFWRQNRGLFLATLALFAALLVEALCQSIWILNRNTTPQVSIAYLVSGLLLACIPLLPVQTLQVTAGQERVWLRWVFRAILWGMFAWIAVRFWEAGSRIIGRHPLDYMQADMMPIIQVMCRRFLNGEEIYTAIPQIWGNRPIYLPAMWMPFVPFEALGIDIRWGTVLGLLLAGWLALRVAPVRGQPWGWLVLLVLIPLWLISEATWLEKVERVIRYSEEGVVVAWYLFLGWALSRRNPWLTGIALAGCLLSRYSLLFWTPVLFFFVFLFRSRRQAWIITAVAGLIGLFGFLIPWGIENWAWFTSIPGEYPAFALRNRQIDPLYAHINLGLSKFFSDAQIPLLFNLQLAATAIAPMCLLLLAAWLRRRARIETGGFELASLKLTLVLFYNLVVVPVGYLFFVNSLFSLIVWGDFLRRMYFPQPAVKP
ncbi:MAG: hypothetical protein NW241_18280 [Bacteroidia bacterium]|nr:hypothetical protein [Bacteroidia bacterium]